MRRFALLTTFVASAALLAPTAATAAKFGISDQQASTFANPLYAPLKLKEARYVAPYDVMFDPTQLGRWDAWYHAASGARQKMLVSFEHSRTNGKQQSTPTLGQYQAAMAAFHAKYPLVKQVNTWNEVNACQKGSATERQPAGICKPAKAKLLVQFWGVSKKVFKGAKIIPVDVLDDRSTSAKTAVAYIKAFKKALRGKALPKIWGIHNYSDTNRFSQVRTKKILKAIGPRGEIWLLETGGQLSVFGGSDAKKQAGAAKALGCMFYVAKNNPRIKYVFIYQFNGAAPGQTFDAGLISSTNQVRAGYTVVKKRTAKKC